MSKLRSIGAGMVEDNRNLERCQRCNRPYRMYVMVSNEDWERITGIPPAGEKECGGGLLCPDCIDALATAQGLTNIVARYGFVFDALTLEPYDDSPHPWDIKKGAPQ